MVWTLEHERLLRRGRLSNGLYRLELALDKAVQQGQGDESLTVRHLNTEIAQVKATLAQLEDAA